MNEFTVITPEQITANPFQMIGKDWMLITAGNQEKANTMTASWGGVGVLWNKPVSYIFVRPTRYTYAFLEQEEGYSLCFFDEEYRDALKVCGTVSGRDRDKIADCGLTLRYEEGIPYFDQAKTVLFCKKLCYQDMDPTGFIDPAIEGHYHNDYHRIYVGEITRVLTR